MYNFLIHKQKLIREIFHTSLELLYPDNISCIICNNPIKTTNTYSLCTSCFKELHFILDGCLKCGKPTINDSLGEIDTYNCRYCKCKSFYFDRAISCIEYSEFSKKVVFGLKYNSKTYMSRYIATIMKERIELEPLEFDYILFVPLHKKRQRKRGFNQSEKIAKYLGEILGKDVLDIIVRTENTKRLYKLNKEERKKELKNVFELKEESFKLKNKNILLVDDIFTTGSTVNEISKILKLNNVNRVTVITFLTRTIDT